MAEQSLIVSLSLRIAQNVAIVDAFFNAQGLPSPTFENGQFPQASPAAKSPEIAEACERVLTDMRDLKFLIEGPGASMRKMLNHNDVFVIQAIDRFNIAEAVPLDGEASFDEIASKSGITVPETRRIIRYAATSHIFKEPRLGVVEHTPASRMLAEDRIMRSAMSMSIHETVAASTKSVESMEKHPSSQESTLSGWGLFNNASTPMFEELEAKYPKRAQNATTMMTFMSLITPTQPLVDGYDWAGLGKATVVDVGGAQGPVSIALAKKFPDLEFVVQDLAGPVAEGQTRLPEELKSRISFVEHDLFTEQPVKGADVYFFRATLHNWPDKYCIRMLKALIPALKKGARVIVNDTCLPEPGVVSPHRERDMRNLDLNMFHLFNARDREASEWEQLFTEADPRWEFRGARAPVNKQTGELDYGEMSIIEAVWQG